MQQAAIAQITTRLLDLPDDKLAVVYDFISYLAEYSMPLGGMWR